jgi:hypothetical protein
LAGRLPGNLISFGARRVADTPVVLGFADPSCLVFIWQWSVCSPRTMRGSPPCELVSIVYFYYSARNRRRDVFLSQRTKSSGLARDRHETKRSSNGTISRVDINNSTKAEMRLFSTLRGLKDTSLIGSAAVKNLKITSEKFLRLEAE